MNWFQILILETIGAFEILSNYSVVNYVSFIFKIIEVGLRFFADLLAANLLAVAIITIIDLLKSKSKDPQCCGVRFDVQFELILIRLLLTHNDVIKWKHFPRYWPFVQGIHRSPVNSPHKGQWRGALMFTLICARINGWANSREAGDLRRYRPHYDVIVMKFSIMEYK